MALYKEIDSRQGKVKIYQPEAFEKMRAAGQLAAQTLDFITPHVKSGISTLELNDLCHDFITSHNATPAPLNYKGFPKSICTSVNNVICHGIPNAQTVLKDKDIINIDVTVILDGWYGDTSRMFTIGHKTSKAAMRLINATYETMMTAIEAVRPGVTTGDLGHIMQKCAERYNYSIAHQFCSHGLGVVFHDNPNILHYGKPGTGVTIEEGMMFTIEPLLNIGGPNGRILADGWTAVTNDNTLSAQFEHSLGVTADGCEIFTHSPQGWKFPPYQ